MTNNTLITMLLLNHDIENGMHVFYEKEFANQTFT